MNDFNLINQITSETMRLGDTIEINKAISNIDEVAELQMLQNEMIKLRIPEHCGVLFYIYKTSGAFRFEFFVSTNMFSDYKKFQKKLKEQFEHDDEERVIHSFKTDTLHLAEVVVSNLAKKRFPLEEGQMGNISDPGFSWWLKSNEQSIEISFSIQENSQEEWLNIGLLADDYLSMHIFSKLCWQKIGVNYSSFKNGFTFLANNKDVFTQLQSFFIDGENSLLKQIEKISSKKSTFFFFQELIAVRNFWISAYRVMNKNYLLKPLLKVADFDL